MRLRIQRGNTKVRCALYDIRANLENVCTMLLKATDFESLDVISTLMYNAIFYSTSFHFHDNVFQLFANRFMWEEAVKHISGEANDELDEAVSDDEHTLIAFDKKSYHKHFRRTHAVLTFYNVESVDLFGIDRSSAPMTILAIHASDNEIHIVIANKKHIRLRCSDIRVHYSHDPQYWFSHNLHAL